MCLKPRIIRNPTKRVSRLGGQPLFMEVNCNQCAECKKNIRREWRFRSYHMCDATLKRKGYVLYDTLTYSEEHVPHLSDFYDIKGKNIKDFTCFNCDHWRKFLKNLRRQIEYHCKKLHIVVEIKYFLVSEYGTDERYTHRPHYHILIFVSSPFLSPITLSHLIAKCWKYGRTDGIDYDHYRNGELVHPMRYLAENVFGYDLGFGQNQDILKVCGYVSKYITKDSTFQNEIDNRVELLKKYITDEEELKKLFRNINMFHRQSKGFGRSYVDNLDQEEYDYIFNTGCARIKDKKKVVLTVKLPLYYKRKLFYNCLKDAENKWFWQLNARGIDYQQNSMLRSIQRTVDRYKEILANYDCPDVHSYVSRLLGARSLEDFVIYKLFYKGRSRAFSSFHFDKLYQCDTLSDDEYNLYDWINTIIESSFVRTASHFDFFERDVDRDTISFPVAYGNLFDDNPAVEELNYSNYVRQIIFNQNSCRAFNGFDDLDAYFNQLLKPDLKLKQDTFDFIEDLQKRLKIYFNE